MIQTILFGIVGWNIAETTRMIEIAKHASLDFNVYFVSYGGQFDHLIDEAGFELFNLSPFESPKEVERLWKIDRGEMFGQPYSVKTLKERVSNELELFKKINPKVLVMGSVLSFPISARIANIPLVNVIPFALSRSYFNNNLPLLPDYPKWVNSILNGLVYRLPLLTKNFNIVAKSYNLPKFRNIVSIWEGDYNLLTELPSLFKDIKLDDNWKFVGPIYANLAGEVPQHVAEFINQSEYPCVYFAMGSSANITVLKQVIECFDELPLRIIAPIQSHINNVDIKIPSNMLVTDWLPALKVNTLCDIAVIHGGQGTIQTACDSGTPFIGIGMQPEQSVNIEMIARYGSAINISRNKISKQLITQSINELINYPKYKQKAKELMNESLKINGAFNVASFLKDTFNNDNKITIPKTPYTIQLNRKP
jgi:UDP:flavonoid glycosyltransferase YjiC (YdhE family)